ncbi:hypothetical protein E5A73_07645 [Sphingomonas gei]|uniref:Aminoacyl-tRNA hydrolase n=1 Tax=Sphingomonas gei TaxID=1395960 RepID=A0A4S1XEJ4_9SPHN|nr:hypothetical protein E5A73_07645 [Sphingomonas gei]
MSVSAVTDLEEAIVEEKFLAASGPGGQNVNKVSRVSPNGKPSLSDSAAPRFHR